MPYQPGPGSRSAQIIADGWKNVGNVLGQAMLQSAKNQEEAEAADATASALQGLFKQSGAPLPEGWEKFASLSTAGKKAFLGTAAMGLTQHQREKEDAERLLRMQQTAQQINAANRVTQANAALGTAFQQANAAAPYSIAGPGMPHQGQSLMERFAMAVGQNPLAAQSPQFGDMMNVMLKAAPPRARGIEFKTSPTGATIALSPDTGAFQYDPYSRTEAERKANAGKVTARSVPVLDKFTGEPTGQYMMTVTGDDPSAVNEWVRKINGQTAGADDGGSYESEAAARQAGAKAGDVIVIKGVGKVRLK